MTNGEIETIRNIIARLKEKNCGCGNDTRIMRVDDEINTIKIGDVVEPRHMRTELVSRVYIDTWLIGALECLLPGDGRDVGLAKRMSNK